MDGGDPSHAHRRRAHNMQSTHLPNQLSSQAPAASAVSGDADATTSSSAASTAPAASPTTPLTSAAAASSKPRSSAQMPLPPPPAPWEPRSINLYKRESMTLIGEGTYGSVWLARGPTGVKVALKKIRKEKKEGFPITAIREIKLLKMLKHPNIVTLKDVVSSHLPGRDGDVFMVFEFLDHDLTGLLESKVQLSDAVIKYYLKCILEGLAYMHSVKVLHRDIKGANILISNNGDVRIADLGLARGMAKGSYTNRVVTLWYRAPELLLGSSDYDSKIDLWSTGCLMAELLTRGTVLFPGTNTELDQLNKIYAACGTPDETSWPGVSNLKYFQQFTPRPQKRTLKSMFAGRYSAHAVDLLDKLLTLNPAERLSAEQALDHEYFFEEPLPIQPHQHPIFNGNHHEYGSKQRRRHPPAGGRPAAGGAAASSAAGGPTGSTGPTAAAAHHAQGHQNNRGPAPFDRMNVTSHASFGAGGFALNQPQSSGHHAQPAYPSHPTHGGQQPADHRGPPSAYQQRNASSAAPYPPHNNAYGQQPGGYRGH